jgi:hypothetical protein
VSLPNPLSPKESGTDESPERKTLLEQKNYFLKISQELQPPADLVSIKRDYVKLLITDLGLKINEMKKMKSNPSVSQYFKSDSLGKVYEMVRLYAFVALNTALVRLDEGETEEYFRCLLKCAEYLEEAIDDFKI